MTELGLESDMVVTAHWMLSKLSAIEGGTRMLTREIDMEELDREQLRDMIEHAVSQCSAVLLDLARGVPASLAGVPFVERV